MQTHGQLEKANKIIAEQKEEIKRLKIVARDSPVRYMVDFLDSVELAAKGLLNSPAAIATHSSTVNAGRACISILKAKLDKEYHED